MKEQRLPSFTALRAFYYVARQQSMRLAAADLCVSPTAISHQIRILETELGITLFIRHARSLEMTTEAQRLYQTLTQAFGDISSCVESIRSTSTSRSVNVAASPLFAAKWLLPRLSEFEARNPGVSVRVLTTPVVDLAVVDADIAFRYCDGQPEAPGFDSVKLFDVVLEPVCSPQLVERQAVQSASDLLGVQLLHDEGAGRPGWVPDWADFLAFHGCVTSAQRLQGRSFSSAYMVMESAIAGHGWALAIAELVAEDLRAGRLVRPFGITMSTQGQYWMHTRKGSQGHAPVHAFVEWLTRLDQP